MEVVTKNKMIDMLARCEMALAERRLEEGKTDVARLLFADSAGKYEYIASTRDKKVDGMRTLEHALKLALKADDQKRIYSITSRIVELEVFPERRLRPIGLLGSNFELVGASPLIRGVQKKTEVHSPDMTYYKYIIDMSNGNFERIVEVAGDGDLKKTLMDLKREQIRIEDDALEGMAITLNYTAPTELMDLSSRHKREDSEYVKNVINVLGNSLELLLK